jgi:7-cyano-7-deazaguanine synthase
MSTPHLEFFSGSAAASHLARVPDTHYEVRAMSQVIVPFRNGIFLAAAAGLVQSIGATAVVIAAHADDHTIFPDCRPEFMDSMSRATVNDNYPSRGGEF